MLFFLLLYYSLLIVLYYFIQGVIIFATVLYLLYSVFSLIDIFVLKYLLSHRYSIIYFLYLLLSYFLCLYTAGVIEKLHYLSISDSTKYTYMEILNAFTLDPFFMIILFIIFIFIKIIPHSIMFIEIRRHFT
jgi:hypothetical protein